MTGSIYTALDHDLTVLAATGMRTTFDRASELLGIDPGKPFAKKLDDLVLAGQIGTTERNTSQFLSTPERRGASSMGAEQTELDTMMAILEHFLTEHS